MDEPIREVLRDRVVNQVRSQSHCWALTGDGLGTMQSEVVEVDGRRFQAELFGSSSARVFDTDHPHQQARCTPYQSAAMRGLTR